MSSLLEAPVTTGEIAVGTRKVRRVVQTQEIRVRSTHRRRQVLTRGGVLIGFVLAMVVYPVFGTITPYADAAQALPGVVKGQSPTTAMAILGDGPQLVSSDLPLPPVNGSAEAQLASNSEVIASPLPDCHPGGGVVGSNGRLSASSLCELWKKGAALQPDAAIAMTELNSNFRILFGRDVCLASTYRTLADQYRTKANRGYLAAAPGSSLHGWGIAVDFCSGELKGESGKWIRDNARTYGWGNPSWAKGSQFEPWHYEYVPVAATFYSGEWGVLH